MKDEIASVIASCMSFDALKEIVDDWIDYYNKDRYQWELLKLSPNEYYRYLITGVYPLPKYEDYRCDCYLGQSSRYQSHQNSPVWCPPLWVLGLKYCPQNRGT